MAKYKIIYHWTDGTEDEDDNYGEYYLLKRKQTKRVYTV